MEPSCSKNSTQKPIGSNRSNDASSNIEVVDLTNDDEEQQNSSDSDMLEISAKLIQKVFRKFLTCENRPAVSLKLIISTAIFSSPEKHLSLADIQRYIADRFLYYRKYEQLRDALRACLQTDYFRLYRCRCPTSPGKVGVCVLSDADIWTTRGRRLKRLFEDFYRKVSTQSMQNKSVGRPENQPVSQESDSMSAMGRSSVPTVSYSTCSQTTTFSSKFVQPVRSKSRSNLHTGTEVYTCSQTTTVILKSPQPVQCNPVERSNHQHVREQNDVSAKSLNSSQDGRSSKTSDAGNLFYKSCIQTKTFSSKSQQMSVPTFSDKPKNNDFHSIGRPESSLLSKSDKDSRDFGKAQLNASAEKADAVIPFISSSDNNFPPSDNSFPPSDNSFPPSDNSFHFPPPHQNTNQQGPECFEGPPGFQNNFQGGTPNNYQRLPNGFMSRPDLQRPPTMFDPSGSTDPTKFMGPLPGQGHFDSQLGNRPPFNQQPQGFHHNANNFSGSDRFQTVQKPQIVITNEPLIRSSGNTPFCFPPPHHVTNHQGTEYFEGPHSFQNNFRGGTPINYQYLPNIFTSRPDLQRPPTTFDHSGFTGPPTFIGPLPGQGNFDSQFGNRTPFNQRPPCFRHNEQPSCFHHNEQTPCFHHNGQPPCCHHNSSNFSCSDGLHTNKNFNYNENSQHNIMNGWNHARPSLNHDTSGESNDGDQQNRSRRPPQKSTLEGTMMATDSPAEPDFEIHSPPLEPPNIPLDDLTGSFDSINDFTFFNWPDCRSNFQRYDTPPPVTDRPTVNLPLPQWDQPSSPPTSPSSMPTSPSSPGSAPPSPTPSTEDCCTYAVYVRNSSTQTVFKTSDGEAHNSDEMNSPKSLPSASNTSERIPRLRNKKDALCERKTRSSATSTKSIQVKSAKPQNHRPVTRRMLSSVKAGSKKYRPNTRSSNNLSRLRKKTRSANSLSKLGKKRTTSCATSMKSSKKPTKELIVNQIRKYNEKGDWRGWKKAPRERLDRLKRLIESMSRVTEVEQCDQPDRQKSSKRIVSPSVSNGDGYSTRSETSCTFASPSSYLLTSRWKIKQLMQRAANTIKIEEDVFMNLVAPMEASVDPLEDHIDLVKLKLKEEEGIQLEFKEEEFIGT